MTVEPTTQDKQITIDVPEDRVAEFYAFYGRFLAGSPDAAGPARRPAPPLRRPPPWPSGHGHADETPTTAAERDADRLDGRQADHRRRAGGARTGVLRLVRGLPGGGGRRPPLGRAPRRRSRRPAPRLRRAGRLVGRGRRAGRLAVRQARAARARALRRAHRRARRAPRRQRDRRPARASRRAPTASPASSPGPGATRARSPASCRSPPRAAPTAAPTTTWSPPSPRSSPPRAGGPRRAQSARSSAATGGLREGSSRKRPTYGRKLEDPQQTRPPPALDRTPSPRTS